MNVTKKYTLLAAMIIVGASQVCCMIPGDKKLELNAENLFVPLSSFEQCEHNESDWNNLKEENNAHSHQKIIFPVAYLGNGTEVFIEYPHTAKIVEKDGSIVRKINLNPHNVEKVSLLGFEVIKPFNLIVASLGNPRTSNDKESKKITDEKTFFIFDTTTGACIKECKNHKKTVFSFVVRNEPDKSYLLAFSPHDQTSSEWEIQKGKDGIEINCTKEPSLFSNDPNEYNLPNTKDCRPSMKVFLMNGCVFVADFKNDGQGEDQPMDANWTNAVTWIDQDRFLIKPAKARLFKNQENQTIGLANHEVVRIYNKKDKKTTSFANFYGMSRILYIDSTQTIIFARPKLIFSYNLLTKEGSRIFKDSSTTQKKDDFSVLEKMKEFNVLVAGSVQGKLRFIDLSTNKLIKEFDLLEIIESFDSFVDKENVVWMIIGLGNGKKVTWKISSKNIKFLLSNMKKRIPATVKTDGFIEKKKQPYSDITIRFKSLSV